ncbi:CHAD domain-containing protein [Arenimonas sp.]|uniref:CHAD domain-containing protein n=1 Tax=Arenimonas sp. TaxID=1872635 RepID=UPI0025DEA9CC|nr:CHAD domain-containing protein [Arenimonas sp.]
MPEVAPPVSPASDAPPIGDALRAFALDELANAARQLAREGGDRHAGIHQARKSLRRVRATLALARRALGEPGRQLDGDIARLCRGLSALRDGQALVEALKRLDPAESPALQALLPQAIALATARREALLQRALAREPDLARRRQRIQGFARRLARLPWDEVRGKRVARAIARSERRLDKARARVARQPGHDERWHVLRRRLRRLRQQDHLLLALAPDLRPVAGVPLDEATMLGEAQDDVLLLRHCGSRSPFPPALRRELRAVARERLRRVREAVAAA